MSDVDVVVAPVTTVDLVLDDGTRPSVLPAAPGLVIGSRSAPVLRHHDIRRQHARAGFHDGVFGVQATAPRCCYRRQGSQALLRLDSQRSIELADGDVFFLHQDDDYVPRFPLTVCFVTVPLAPLPHTPSLEVDEPLPDPRDHHTLVSRALVAERRAAMLEGDVDRLHAELQMLRVHEALRDDALVDSLAARVDALDRRRIREEGIYCSCCALLRLPDHFFPAMLRTGVDVHQRRCVFCMAYVREHHDLFGRPFFLPSGFSMPACHADDLDRLSRLRRCPSCAAMRHPSLLAPFEDAEVFTCLYSHSTWQLEAPISSESPRASIPIVSICRFCRRGQRSRRRSDYVIIPGSGGASITAWGPQSDAEYSGSSSEFEDDIDFDEGDES